MQYGIVYILMSSCFTECLTLREHDGLIYQEGLHSFSLKPYNTSGLSLL